jgi:hypothetical protein
MDRDDLIIDPLYHCGQSAGDDRTKPAMVEAVPDGFYFCRDLLDHLQGDHHPIQEIISRS